MVLQVIRERLTGPALWVILGILIVPFAFVGVNEYLSSGSGNQVALVNDEEITFEAFNQSFINYRRGMQQRMGEAFNPAEYDSLVARLEYLDQMIDEELLRQAAMDMDLAVDDARLAETIRSIPAFQVEGVFNADVYQARVQSMGMSIPQFESELRSSAVLSTLPQGIRDSSFATRSEYEEFVALTEQTRSFRVVTVAADTNAVEPVFSEAEQQAWYEDHLDRFLTEETVVIEFLDLDMSTMSVGEMPSEDALLAAYEAQKGRFIVPERRRVSHILIEAPADADSAAVEAARLQAEALARQAREGDDFAALAEANSEDIGSAPLGGDLGFIEPGVMAESFEAAVYELSMDNPVSDPVQTGFGWHVIMLTDIEPAAGMPFEEAREVLIAEAMEEQGERLFLDLADRMVDIVYEDPTTLEAAALDLELDIQTEGPFTRAGGLGIASNAEVVAAAFSELVLEQGSASDLIDLGPSHAVVLRVLEHEPVRTMALDEVRPEVIAGLQQDAARAVALERAAALLAEVEAGMPLDEVAGASGLLVQNLQSVGRNSTLPDPLTVSEVFSLPRPEGDEPLFKVVESAAGYSLVELDSVTDGTVDAGQLIAARQARMMMGTINAGVEAWALVRQLREQARVEIFEENLGVSR
jgi:peptidyl-prolyl cis-trans isomerase D